MYDNNIIDATTNWVMEMGLCFIEDVGYGIATFVLIWDLW